jgi:hypothetical protein
MDVPSTKLGLRARPSRAMLTTLLHASGEAMADRQGPGRSEVVAP